MDDLLMKLIKGKTFTDADLENELHEVCEQVHAGCDDGCPVFEANGGIPWNGDLSSCKCFKDGNAMLAFLRERE